jgi:hypothetical protein
MVLGDGKPLPLGSLWWDLGIGILAKAPEESALDHPYLVGSVIKAVQTGEEGIV